MLNENINSMIMSAMKAGERDKANVYRLIKNEFLKFSTSKNAGVLNESTEITILQKMVKQREESIEQFMAAGREELANEEHKQMVILKEFLPAEATEEDIVRVFLQVKDINGWEPIKKNMGLFVKEIKKALPSADGKLVAQTVQKHLS